MSMFFRFIRRISTKKGALLCVAAAFTINLSAVAALAYCYFNGITGNQAVLMVPAPIRHAVERVIKEIQNLPYLPYRLMLSNLPVYRLNIKQEKLDELNQSIPTDVDNWTDDIPRPKKSAKFKFGKDEYEVKVQYRGIGTWHWLYPQKSWRIKFEEPAIFEGIHQLDLIVPYDRGYISEAFNNWRAEKLGLPVPRSKFVELFVNGKSHGVYFAVEKMSPVFLERANLMADTNLYTETGLDQPIFTDLKYWQKISTNSTEETDNYAELNKLLAILKSDDRYFNKNIWNLVDKDNFIKWNVHSMLSGSTHEDWSHNMRLYFDKTVGKFKFTPWDVELRGDVLASGLNINYHPLITRLLLLTDFLLERDRALWSYVNDAKNLDDDLKQFDKLYKETRIAFYKDTLREFTNKSFDNAIASGKRLIEDNFKAIKQGIDKSGLRSFIILNDNRGYNTPLAFELETADTSPILFKTLAIKTISTSTRGSAFSIYYDINDNGKFDAYDKKVGDIAKDKPASNINVVLKTALKNKNDEYIQSLPLDIIAKKYRFFLIPRVQLQDKIKNIELDFGAENIITGTKSKVSVLYLDNGIFQDFDDISLSINEFVQKNPSFIKKDSATVVLPAGSYYFKNDVIVPKNIKLEISAGATLRLDEGASIVSYGPVSLLGQKGAPIKFLPANPAKPWGTFAIIDTKEKSKIQFSEFSGGGDDTINGAFLSGMVSVYSTDIEISGSIFTRAHGDDSLNIKNGQINLYNNRFYNNSSDGFDGDYVEGEIHDNYFEKNGGDGIDISGSTATIRSNKFSDADDKCISIGEHSTPLVANNILKKCNIGIAVKDSSEAKIENNEITDCATGISAYRKKELWETGGTIILKGNKLANNTKDIELDKHSQQK